MKMSVQEEFNKRFCWETYHKLADGQLVEYHYSEHCHEDEFGYYVFYDPHTSLLLECEKENKQSVVATVVKFWVSCASTRKYNNETETVVLTQWKENITFVEDEERRHWTYESLSRHFNKSNIAAFQEGKENRIHEFNEW